MDKIYNHILVEQGIEKEWRVEQKVFSKHDLNKKPFSILLPPPNVTGKLHLGHAFDTMIPDTIIRYKKLKGFDTFWISGMDHAGIATQAKVEADLYETKGLTKHDLGREKFLDLVWDWKEKYATMFREQWAKLGLALDYENERFTLDKDANEAVLKIFVDFYNKGLIYKDVKAINWDTKLKTAVSNIEINNTETNQIMYYIKYFIENSDQYLTIATVRTETLLSDVAVVYNPSDKRYSHLKGKFIIHPITKKRLPIITDGYVDPKFGSGLMKLSAHAEVDIDIIKKHKNLEIIETIDQDGFINAPESIFHKQERFEARKNIAKFLKENNLLEKEEQVVSSVGYSDRSNTPVEILVLPQWFVKMENFGKIILEHLQSKNRVDFYPKRFVKILKHWMSNVHDWTISRQLWWGHRIPAWYKDDQIKVQIESPGLGWVQDPDVLDTWFSSGLSPFVFLGWPQNDKMLKRYYPTDVLVTGSDLIFFWIARMYMFGLDVMKEKPFKHLLIHGLIRDAQGRKMSKSLNNGIDPLDVINEYGADALKWFLITNTSPGLDIKYSTEKLKSAWALCNKLWNISRFIEQLPQDQNTKATDADKWINNKLQVLIKNIDKAMKNYEFTLVGSQISKFIYTDLSGWYVEFLKSNPSKKFAMELLKNTLIAINPFLSFITYKIFKEVLNDKLYDYEYPKLKVSKNITYIDNVIEIVTELRKYREENNISKKELISWYADFELDSKAIDSINKLAYAQVEKNNDVLLSFAFGKLFIKVSEEQKQTNKTKLLEKIEKLNFEINRAKKMLENTNFVAKAPKEKIEEEKEKLIKFEKELKNYLEELKWKY
ncbi:valine--tRNA ligase [Mycoplasmopsis alligatoris]|uniref:Valine--tRNA ligase n=1 Tax=Mycoplasmopsis alligatoris A21JP2 TaxID=747682 RepID=D4XW79_9BACT|nr:valine--tRNA ligase [Mycoplasmopsis alligatoris]EFF41390.1 valine--tRNA ligase [Mycoplasmopsis alligatoris A21JP2]